MPLNLLFKTPVPNELPEEIRAAVAELDATESKRDCLQLAYDILCQKYRGLRLETYTKFFSIFIYSPEKIWQKEGFLHCTNMNYMLRVLLESSQHFSAEDIKLRWCLVWYHSPHQYLLVDVGDQWIEVDIWGYDYGIELGRHAVGFNT